MSPEELAASAFTFMGLRTVPVAVTTVHGARTNGLVALSGRPASVIPEASRAMVGITKYNFSHDLVLNGGVFVIHVLGNAPELLDASLDIIRLGQEWTDEYERNHEEQIEHCRRMRGLPSPGVAA
jgi:hypothetical protein